jgi:malonyl-CoA O-methyltransferase
MTNQEFAVKKSDIARSFSLAAKSYDKHAIIQQEVGFRLLERLDLLNEKPKTILDVGAGTGFFARRLQQKFPKACVLGADLAFGMSEFSAKQSCWVPFGKKPGFFTADAEFLPIKTGSIDLIFSNFTLQWCFNLKAALAEFKRVLSPTGTLLFTTLGPNTLTELRQSFAAADDSWHVNPFSDMHDIGDILLNLQFQDPVIDMEMLTLTYPDLMSLFADLKLTGATNLNAYRRPGLTSPRTFAKMNAAYDNFKQGNVYPASFEVIYGHAIKMQQSLYRQEADGRVFIPGESIPVLEC